MGIKIVINHTYGGFCLEGEALKRYLAYSGDTDVYPYSSEAEFRESPHLVRVVEELSDQLRDLKIVEIPFGTHYEIEEYDGLEWIAEIHRTWE